MSRLSRASRSALPVGVELREFAERIVLGTTLEDKLVSCDNLVDTCPGASPPAIQLPGRPAELILQSGGHRLAAPNIQHIESDRERGVLLHFLANHELLATELMALVLLKFPDAPAAFRQGVLETLREEQAHTRLYLHRMQECGVHFGEFPLSGYFWRMVEPMNSPLEFVSRLSLTFEQANLDYSKYYAARFAEAGDKKTASILNAIYLDEIGHVNHGLTWFRQWKKQADSDWDAYRSVMHFPLSPARAKATEGPFNRAGRIEAGLDKEFIDQLELFRHSRGRMPTVRWFHPGAETDLQDSPVPPREAKVMNEVAADLETLLFPLSAEDDVVLLRRKPSDAFLTLMVNARLTVPEQLSWPADSDFGGHPLLKRKLGELAPWAWTPSSYLEAEALLPITHRPPPAWNPARKSLYEKSGSLRLSQQWITDDPSLPDSFFGAEVLGNVVDSMDELDGAVSDIASRGFSTALLKADLGAAGRGQRRVNCNAPRSEVDQAALGACMEGQGRAVVEPCLERVLDLSLQWNQAADGLHFLGWTRQLIQPGRRYLGSVVGRPFDDLPLDLKRFLVEDRYARLWELEAWLRLRLAEILLDHHHVGPIGVDVLLARRADGNYAFKPVVEINPRHTMGQVALRLEKRIAKGAVARFLLLTHKQIKTLSFSNFSEAAETLAVAHPAQHRPSGGLSAGIIPLADAAQTKRLLPLLAIGHDAIRAIPLATTDLPG